jgi:hypothetical protein
VVTLTSPDLPPGHGGGPGGVTILGGNSNVSATWSTLNNIYGITSAANSVQVQVTFNGGNNMFSNPNYASLPVAASTNLANGTYQIVVTFTFQNATFTTNTTPWTLTFGS